MIDVFIPSYHRPHNLKTVKYLLKKEYAPNKIHVVIDDEADDADEYDIVCKKFGVNLHVFNMDEARARYENVHRPSESRRGAGQARNMFYDIAKKLSINFYVVMDDDTTRFEIKKHGKYFRIATAQDIFNVFASVKEFMMRRRIGLFGLSQTGDFIGGNSGNLLLRKKVMNTTFVNTEYIYRGERGVQDDDTSMFCGVMNAGLFTGSAGEGLVLGQVQSAKQAGGLTDLYRESGLLNKSLVTVIQYPSAIHAERQKKNGNRIHHKINYRYLQPKLLRTDGADNIAWDTYAEDVPFTLEPIRQTTN